VSQPSVIVTIASSNLPGANARAHCKRCNNETGYLARYIKASGIVAVRWVCDWCEDYTTAGDLPRSILTDVSVHRDHPIPIDDLPLRIDNRGDDSPLCAVCDSNEVEYHHWAPVSLFPDWDHVPGVYLCPMHHQEWHHRLRAHGLRYPHELASAS